MADLLFIKVIIIGMRIKKNDFLMPFFSQSLSDSGQ
jgi:hypothetical protein